MNYSKTMVAKAIALCCFMGITFFAKAQTTIEWISLSSKDGVQVFYKVEQCTQGNVILFRIENTTAENKAVDFDCTISGTSEINVPSLKNKVQANSTLEGTCEDNAFSSAFISLPGNFEVKQVVGNIK